MRSHWLETLCDGRFKMAKISDFNDPFDGRGRCVGKLSKEAIRNIVKEANTVGNQILETLDKVNTANSLTDQILDAMIETYSIGLCQHVLDRSMMNLITYVLCFSACKDDDPNQKLMWAHYAGGHRGVRIGVRFDDTNFPSYLDSVKYCHERPIFDLSKVHSLNDPEILHFWISNLTTKSTEWAYEQEVRLIVDDKHLEKGLDDKGDEAYYWKFSPQGIVSVDVGCQIPQEEINKIIELRNSKYPHVAIRQVELNDSDYGISYKRLI